METQFQDSVWIREEATKMLKVNKNRRISAMFRDLKKKAYLSIFGDYIFFSEIIQAIKSLKLPLVREQVSYAFQFSPELSQLQKRMKTSLLNTLTLPLKKQSSGAMKKTKSRQIKRRNRKK